MVQPCHPTRPFQIWILTVMGEEAPSCCCSVKTDLQMETLMHTLNKIEILSSSRYYPVFLRT